MKKKTKSIRRTYKNYGSYAGYLYMVLLYSYMKGMQLIKNENALSVFNIRFRQYVQKEYGSEFYVSFLAFYNENKDNKKLLRALEKRKQVFLDAKVVLLIDEPLKTNEIKKEKGESSAYKKPVPRKQDSQVRPLAAKETIPSKIKSTKPEEKGMVLDVTHMSTAQHFFYDGPTRNINYIPYASIQYKKTSYKIVLKRYSNDEKITTYRQGKDVNEVMSIVNRVYYDSARIISIEEELTGKKVL